MSTTPTIDKLIAEVEAENQRLQDEYEQRRMETNVRLDAEAIALHSQISEVLGDIWTDLAPFANPVPLHPSDYHEANDEHGRTIVRAISIAVNPPEMLPFRIWSEKGGKVNSIFLATPLPTAMPSSSITNTVTGKTYGQRKCGSPNRRNTRDRKCWPASSRCSWPHVCTSPSGLSTTMPAKPGLLTTRHGCGIRGPHGRYDTCQ